MDGASEQDAHEVVFTSAARRAVEALPIEVTLAALALVAGDLAEQPYRVGTPLRASLEGQYSARRGDYRILYRIAERKITILDVRHRQDACRP